MMDFTFTNPQGVVSMTDILVTIAAFFAGWTKYAQKAKDDQIANRDAEIKYLRERVEYLEEQVKR